MSVLRSCAISQPINTAKFMLRQPETAATLADVIDAAADVLRLDADDVQRLKAEAQSGQDQRRALKVIRKAAGSSMQFTNRLQFIHARAGAALDGVPWDDAWKADHGYAVRQRTMIENDELRAQLAAVGWIVANGKDGDERRYRTIDQGIPVWTPDRDRAIRFARRDDAEQFAAEDEDAWRIEPYATP